MKPDIKFLSLSSFSAAQPVGESATLGNWVKLRRRADRVHCLTYGKATYSDLWTLLMRNTLWNYDFQQYPVSTVANCRDCRASPAPPLNHHVSLSALVRSSTDIWCVHHYHLEDATLFHSIIVTTSFDKALVATSTSVVDAIYAFELIRFS